MATRRTALVRFDAQSVFVARHPCDESRDDEGYAFVLEPQAEQLTKQLHSRIREVANQENSEPVQQLFDYVESVRTTCPELISAWSASAQLIERFPEILGRERSEARPLLERGILETEKLIPKDFEGTLNIWVSANHPYLDALWLAFELSLLDLDFQSALRWAERIRKSDPYQRDLDEAKHIDDHLPLLLLATGERGSLLRKAIERNLESRRSAARFEAGLAQLAQGHCEGLVHVLVGLFEVPERVHALLRDVGAYNELCGPTERAAGVRLSIQAAHAYFRVSGGVMLDWFQKVLQDPELLADAHHYSKLNARPYSVHRQRAQEHERSQLYSTTAPRLLARFPFPTPSDPRG